MNPLIPRFITRAYRKEPISAFVLTMGLVNAIIGGVGERWTLLSFGLLVGSGAIALRWWQGYKKRPISPPKTSPRYLTGSDQDPPLPPLNKKKTPSRRR